MIEPRKDRRSRAWLLVTASVATAVVAAISAAHAADRPPRPPDHSVELTTSPPTTAEASASASAEALSSVADQVAALSDEDFAGLVTDEAQGRIASYWVNDAPQAVHDLAAATPHGVRLDVLTGASYSRSDLKAAGDRIMRDPIWRAIDLSSVAVNPDGSGLKVNLVGALPSASQRAAVADAARMPASALEFRPDEGSIVQLPAKIVDPD